MTTSSSTHTKKIVVNWLPVALYCLLIFIQSSYPATESLPALPYMDKLAHAGGYALLGFLFYRAYRSTGVRRQAVMLLVLSALSAALYGVSDEIHQHFVPSRTADIADMAANAAGSFMGAVAARIVLSR